MEKMQNVRYGVVNVAERTKFEKNSKNPFDMTLSQKTSYQL